MVLVDVLFVAVVVIQLVVAVVFVVVDFLLLLSFLVKVSVYSESHTCSTPKSPSPAFGGEFSFQ